MRTVGGADAALEVCELWVGWTQELWCNEGDAGQVIGMDDDGTRLSVGGATVGGVGGEIEYVVGDATVPNGLAPRIVAHVCNDAGGWGKGFVVAVSHRWREPEAAYRSWYRERATSGFALGAVQLVPVGEDLFVANMIGQHGYRSDSGDPPVRYAAIGTALAALGDQALELGASVHMPRIGCGLAGGRWELVEPLIGEQLTRRGIAVTVYDLQP